MLTICSDSKSILTQAGGFACAFRMERIHNPSPSVNRRLLVITSAFHMKRTTAIFDWVFGIDGAGYSLEYLATADQGLSAEAAAARAERESASAKNVREVCPVVSLRLLLAPQIRTPP
jgi:hypothetical protein